MRLYPTFLIIAVIGSYACTPTPPEGRFLCSSDTDCPSNMFCRPDERRCYRRVVGPDAACPPLDASLSCSMTCGDIDQDGVVDATDVTLLMALVESAECPDACSLSTGDILQDGILTQRDFDALERIAEGENTPGICRP